MSKKHIEETQIQMWFVGIVFAVICIISIIGYHKFEKEYTEYTTAILIDSTQEEYLYAPYHGGRVYPRYNYYYRFEYIVDDEPYWFTIKSDVPVEALDMSVRYNKDNPSSIYINYSDLNPGSSMGWIKY